MRRVAVGRRERVAVFGRPRPFGVAQALLPAPGEPVGVAAAVEALVLAVVAAVAAVKEQAVPGVETAVRRAVQVQPLLLAQVKEAEGARVDAVGVDPPLFEPGRVDAVEAVLLDPDLDPVVALAVPVLLRGLGRRRLGGGPGAGAQSLLQRLVLSAW